MDFLRTTLCDSALRRTVSLRSLDIFALVFQTTFSWKLLVSKDSELPSVVVAGAVLRLSSLLPEFDAGRWPGPLTCSFFASIELTLLVQALDSP